MRSPSPLIPLLLASTAGAINSGCVHVSTANDQAVHADGSVMTSALPLSDTPTYTTPDTASVTGLDRSAWPKTAFTVAQRDVEYQTLYRSPPVAYTHTSAVQRGEYPTPEAAGEDVTNGSRNDQALEGLVAPFNAFGEFLLMIPRAIVAHPTAPARGPTVPVDRVPPGVAPRPVTQPAPAPAAPTPATTEPRTPTPSPATGSATP